MIIRYLASSIILIMVFLNPLQISAKMLPQVAKSSKSSISKPTSSTIGVSPKLRGDRRALNVNFSNLQNAKSVSYMLIYTTNDQQEAASGALNLAGNASQKSELLFGTCSKNVCRYHTNIRDARLEVSYQLKNNKKYLKKYKIKI